MTDIAKKLSSPTDAKRQREAKSTKKNTWEWQNLAYNLLLKYKILQYKWVVRMVDDTEEILFVNTGGYKGGRVNKGGIVSGVRVGIKVRCYCCGKNWPHIERMPKPKVCRSR